MPSPDAGCKLGGTWLPSRGWGKPVSATEAVGMKALISGPTLEVYDPVLLPGLLQGLGPGSRCEGSSPEAAPTLNSTLTWMSSLCCIKAMSQEIQGSGTPSRHLAGYSPITPPRSMATQNSGAGKGSDGDLWSQGCAAQEQNLFSWVFLPYREGVWLAGHFSGCILSSTLLKHGHWGVGKPGRPSVP